MSKKLFTLIVSLMSISLIGIVAVQIYWIRNSIKDKQRQFEYDVIIALAKTSEKIKEKEIEDVTKEYSQFFENESFRIASEIKNYLFKQVDTVGNKSFIYGTFLEESYKIPTGFSINDTAFVKKITGKQNYLSLKFTGAGKDFKKQLKEKKFSSFKRFTNLEKLQFSEIFTEQNRLIPIHKRISNRELNNTLKKELAKRNIKQSFKYGVYENSLSTPLKSGYFKRNEQENFYYPLLADENGNSKYKIYVSFPDEHKNFLSGIMGVLLLSLLFIGIIIAAFSTSLYQLVRQKKISAIKTDFINNMTHEFKTPIATINLALDAIKNPKIIHNEEKVKRYVKMIRDENKRMHGQVESVLRISKLEKKQLDISKNTVEMTDVIEEAIEHVSLLNEDKNGTIKTHFKAIATEVLANQFHLINVVVNILENAIKYSDNQPKIDIFTESTNKFFILKVKDEGIGMSKQAQKYIFDKFYREYKGNVHNVKGHGLGLAYVKEIIDNHHGVVYVESEKGKGSIFTVKLPLI